MPSFAAANRMRLRRPALEPLEDRVLLTVDLPSAWAAASGTIRGVVFEDRDGDGQRDAGEPGLAGRTVWLDTNRNGRLDSSERRTQTGVGGAYHFTGLSAGTYTLATLPPAGWIATAPPAHVDVVTPVSLAGPVAPANDQARQLIGLDRLRADTRFAGLDGSGYSVVVIDTGIDDRHRFFPSGAIRYQYDFVSNDADASDGYGHGTFVASLIAARDARYRGVAPGAGLIVLKVLDDQGNGSFANIERALQWVVANAARYRVACVNLSFGDGGRYATPLQLHGIDDELAALARRHVVVVSAAGNDHPDATSLPGIAYPAADPNVVAVGAVWAANAGGPYHWSTGATDHTTGPDRIASISQRAPGLGEVFAPGMLLAGATPGGGVAIRSGTSAASAVVSGMVVLMQQLAQRHLGRSLTVAEVRSLLASTGKLIRDGDDERDNVRHTGALFRRIDVHAFAAAVLRLPGRPGDKPNPSGGQPWSPAARLVVHLASGQQRSGINLGQFRAGRVSGIAFGDRDGDGRHDPGEPSLAGRLLFLDANANRQLDPAERRTRTDAAGRWFFADLPPGLVEIRQVLPPGWRQTTSEQQRLAVTSGLDRRGLAFGSKQNPVNHAPTLTGPGRLTGFTEDAPQQAGQTVAALLGGTFRDTDPGTKPGIAVVGLTGSGKGRWQYSLDSGRTWRDLGTVSRSAARLLRATDRVRFLPAAHFHGSVFLSYLAWDQSTGTAGALVQLAAGGTAFGTQTVQARLTITPVNDAPVSLRPGRLTPVARNASNPPGDRIQDVLAGTWRDADGATVPGLAVVGVGGVGTWQYSRDAGRTWTALTGSPTRARLLGPADRIRFRPAPGWTGSAVLRYRLWDRTTGVAGGNADLSRMGAATAFSGQLVQATLLVR